MAHRAAQYADPPAYREMYLSFEPGSQLVTTQVTPEGQVVRAAAFVDPLNG